MSIAIAQEFDTAEVLAPEQPRDDGRQRPVARYADVADHQVAARRRGERYGSRRSHPPAVQHPRAASRASARRDAGAGQERGGHGHCGLSIHADRRRPRSRAALFRGVRLCRPRSGARRTVRRLHERAPRANARRIPRARRGSLFASDRRARDARSARAGDCVGQGDVPLRAARKRQERHGRRHRPRAGRRHLYPACPRHRRPGRDHVRSRRARGTRHAATKDRSSDRTATSTAGGFASADRSSPSAAS